VPPVEQLWTKSRYSYLSTQNHLIAAYGTQPKTWSWSAQATVKFIIPRNTTWLVDQLCGTSCQFPCILTRLCIFQITTEKAHWGCGTSGFYVQTINVLTQFHSLIHSTAMYRNQCTTSISENSNFASAQTLARPHVGMRANAKSRPWFNMSVTWDGR